MTLAIGARLGSYEITGSLGAGGMGEVYRARDSKLDRNVAIKVLPALFADDPERRSRFEREARALASLNHPNIAQIYGVEGTAASPAIVMELIEGEDLADRIARGPVPWDEALPIARQIAGALDAAHERGVVHRDLKPANIKVTPDGDVRVLDFGLAKAMAGTDTCAPDPQNSPTLTAVSTRMGVIVGTAAYMSPEQAKGKTVDKRVDIWAFGCVVYEMLTGRSPFGSDSVAESIGLVVTRDPDWDALPASVPPAVVQLIRRCLLKDPKQRLRDIGEASYMLARAGEADPKKTASPVAGRGTRRFLLGIGVTALAVGAASAALAWYVKPTSQVPVRRFELPAVIAAAAAVAISPDGTRLAYVSDGHLYVRDLQETQPRDLGSVPSNTAWLFWSPDSRTVGFTGEGTIRTVPAAGGPTFTVCRIPPTGRVMGIAWRADNMIVFSAWRDSLYQVQATGGTPEVLLPIDPATEVDFHAVSIVPDGRLVVGVHVRDGDSDRAVLVDGTNRTVLTDDRTVRRFTYVHPGFLLFLRTGANQGLWALPFSAGPLDLSRAVLVEPGATLYSAADDGTVVSRAESPALSSLVWLNRDGSTTDVPGSPLEELSSWLALSPDGQRAAYIAGPLERPNLAVRDLASGVDTRVTLNAAFERNLSMWT
ncbi:MAG TPA: protein kinase, partial [Vicinamibacterales bacterium]|nr:protein kinase [Vicinamibacterales bacterium]